jgi:uncharacterized protein (TIGR03118 family)
MAGSFYPNQQYPNPQIVNRGIFQGEEARTRILDPCQNGGYVPPGACGPGGCGHPGAPGCIPCGSSPGPCGDQAYPIPYNPAIHPLMSFADPSLVNECNRPVYNPCRQQRVAVTTWTINYCVSNRPNIGAKTNPFVVNPWGITMFRDQLWVCCGGTDMIMNFDKFGNALLGNITIRDAANNSSYPTGIAINCGSGFTVSNGTLTKSALILCCTESGTVHGYNPNVNETDSYVVINTKPTNIVSVFKGLAVADGRLYLADFAQQRIQVFDSSYFPLTGYNFVDGDTSDPIPADYAPNNIVYLGGYLYVLWARRQDGLTIHDNDGPRQGFISIFNLDGSFVRRFYSRGVLNSPWALIPAPIECGIPPQSILVGNNGDGRINIFDCSGRFIGPLLNQAGIPMVIEGLWGLWPSYTDVNKIYYTAATNENFDGVIGCLTPSQRLIV